ncbi:sulfate ABC transporter permease subunit CysT [Thermosynechococcaceae cyanobacterium BACA0444]|uniref:Sulfate transport system permease protein CysT n=1 Tax=Pseudocalidococcus azoricus BACA0444 TaxID=2918990 RepID=A0AAE4JVB8_9CYAN|nr:sulfate ABC transporter permease subunit CysT [Pseudocalidococcus azoricus]MDS3859826.1 sulfate ABC transporter permease subunit CysT [Pseudocalidococcus azoricus BACA0444]
MTTTTTPIPPTQPLPGSRAKSQNWLSKLWHLHWTWRVTWGYLAVMLLIPTVLMLLKAIQEGPGKFWEVATSPIALSTYDVTFVTAFIAAVINGLFGTLIAWVLIRYTFPGKRFLEGVIDLPFALPTAVAGLTLATVYSNNGWIGSMFAPFGIQISFTRLGVGIAMVFISLPFVVRTVQPVLGEIEKELEEAAWCLGASQWQTFWRVLLPPILPAILTGIALGFSRAVGEYGSTVIISSNIPFKDLIAPVLVFQNLEAYDYTGATIIGTVMLLLSLLLLFVINFIQAWGQRYVIK